jgi:TonB family protein
MKQIFTFIFLVSGISCLAQKQDVYFLKNDGSVVNHRDSADYIRVVKERAAGSVYFGVSEYYPDGKVKTVGESLVPNYPRFDGTVTRYYPNGKRSAVNTYKIGRLTGIQYEFFPNGKAYIVNTYTPGSPNLPIPSVTITSNYDSLGKALVENGTGHFIKYDKDFKYVAEEGDLKNGLKEGEWKFKEDSVTAVELYQGDKFISGTSTLNGDVKTYTAPAAPPTFKGGSENFLRYLAVSVHYPPSEREKNVQGRVVVSFIVEKDGSLSKVKAIQSVSPDMDAEAIRVVKNSPKWIPGTQFGRPVRASFTIPINFSLGYSR